MKFPVKFVLLSALSIAVANTPAQAGLLLDITDSTGGFAGSPDEGHGLTVGFSFSLAQASKVTSLGIFDLGGNGLAQSHDVGLWTVGGTLLATVVIPSGTSATLVETADTGFWGTGSLDGSGWRFVSLNSALSLGPGDYVLAAFYTRPIGGTSNTYDDYLDAIPSIQTSPGVTFGASRHLGSVSLEFPPAQPFGNSYFGPNLQFEEVPEPSSLALLGFGLATFGGAGAWRRRRRTA